MQYRIDDLVADMTRRRVSRNGAPIPLPDMSWRVFAALVERAPGTVSYGELAALAWRRDHVTQDTMAQRIKLLRQALGDDSAAPRYIATERGAGYRLLSQPTPAVLATRSVSRIIPWLAVAAVALTGAALWAAGSLMNSATPRTSSFTPASASISAVDLLDRGRNYLSRGARDANENALTLFEQALDIEPGNVDALIGLSFAYSQRATKYDFGAEAAVEAEILARKALKTAPQRALAWHALGFSLDAQGQVSEALRAYEQAFAIDPGDVSAASSAAYLLQVQGCLHEALLLEVEALNRGAPSLFSSLQIASDLYLAGLDEAARRWLARAKTLTPDNLLLADVETEFLLTSGDFERAVKAAAPKPNRDRRAGLDVLYGEALFGLGRRDEAAAAFEAAMDRSGEEGQGRYESAALKLMRDGSSASVAAHPLIAELRDMRQSGDEWPEASVEGAYLFAAARDAAGAAALLQEARKLGYRNTRRLRHSPFFASVRDSTEFVDVLAAIEEDAVVQRSLIENDPRLAQILDSE